MSPKAISSQPASRQPLGDLEDALRRHLALVGTAEAIEITPSQRSPSSRASAIVRSSSASDSSIERLTFLLVVGLRGGEEDVDLVEAVALLQRALEPALVRDQDRERDPVAALDRVSTSLGIGELRDHVGTHERGHLEPLAARSREQVDQPDLLLGGDDLGLVLEAVAGADLADPDALGKLAMRSVAPADGLDAADVDHAALVGADADRALALVDLDVEAKLAIVDDLAQGRADRAGRSLGGRGDVLDADLEADRRLALGQVLVGRGSRSCAPSSRSSPGSRGR